LNATWRHFALAAHLLHPMELDVYLAFGGQSQNESVERLLSLLLRGSARYALMDVAFDPSIARVLDRRGAVNVFAELGMGELAGLGPRLLHWPAQSDVNREAKQQLSELMEWAGDRPMLSFVKSELEIWDVACSLQRWCLVHTDDGRMSWPFRFADTRVLPCAFELLTPAQQSMLVGIDTWVWPDRRGHWHEQKLEASEASQQDGLHLDDDQFAAFMQAAEPDEILSRLHEVVPEALYIHPPHVNHQLVRDALAILYGHGHDVAGVKLKVALAALTADDGLANQVGVMNAIQTISDSSELEAKLDALLQAEETDSSHV
jgi:hypothetical protein